MNEKKRLIQTVTGEIQQKIANRLKGVDIIAEYALIQQKKSGLSKSNRDLVVALFHKYQQQQEQKQALADAEIK